nr:DUF4822 domain-containing protein [uncultured Dyadobacter sp.]
MKKQVCLYSLSLILSVSSLSCKDKEDSVVPKDKTPAEVLSSIKWKTTFVRDSVGKDVTSLNLGFVGLSEFRPDGTFTITELNGSPKSNGNWALTPDYKKRILVAPTFTRVTDIVALTPTLFTYSTTTASGRITVEHVPQ